MENAVPAVVGRADAVAPVQLLPRVVVAGDVAALDAPERRAVGCHASSDLAEHDERGEEEDEGEGELSGVSRMIDTSPCPFE